MGNILTINYMNNILWPSFEHHCLNRTIQIIDICLSSMSKCNLICWATKTKGFPLKYSFPCYLKSKTIKERFNLKGSFFFSNWKDILAFWFKKSIYLILVESKSSFWVRRTVTKHRVTLALFGSTGKLFVINLDMSKRSFKN